MKLTRGTSSTQTCKKQNSWLANIDIYSIQERRPSLVRFQEPEDKKMKSKREGPFVITKVLGPVTYRLKLPTSWWIHNIFHATLLKPYRENEIYREKFTEPPPELVEGEKVYEVKTIFGHRKQGWGYQYYVQWQGYPISHTSWELEHAFSDDGKILADYKECHHL